MFGKRWWKDGGGGGVNLKGWVHSVLMIITELTKIPTIKQKHKKSNKTFHRIINKNILTF